MANRKNKKYELTAEHREQLAPWRDKWIANAMSTRPMDEAERKRIKAAIRGLYEAANLKAPPDHRIIIVPSPFVARFAGGFAAWVWHRRSRAATRAATDDATRAATYDATDAATAAATSAATRDATAAATDDATRAATYDATDAATAAATSAATRAATSAATAAATSAATRAATSAAASDATAAATDAATDDATRAATYDATDAATSAATLAATAAATLDATAAATRAATSAATLAATAAATLAATAAATSAAASDATAAATSAAASDATAAATLAATDAAWYRVPVRNLCAIANHLGGQAALKCAEQAINMWNGGNQWSGWVAYLSFFRHISNLDIDYSRWDHYEVASEAGPRIMHKEFCIVSERPSILKVDAQNRPHCETGPFCQWRDGTALYAWHGTRTPGWVIEHPELITVKKIDTEENIEVRRVMIQLYGASRYIMDAGAQLVNKDRWGELYRRELVDDDPVLMVKVINSTPEMDGSRKEYWLRVHHECRPLPTPANKMRLGEPQELTAHNAIASTFGLRGESYHPEVET